MLKINEIFKSIQGESSFAGRPCVFIRLTGCNLRCSYCDTKYAYNTGKQMSIPAIIKKVKAFKCNLVEITGGEPLFQEGVYPLIKQLLKNKFTVLLETNGSKDLSRISGQVRKMIDIKCPDSGESEKVYWPNLKNLLPIDEIKFVISSQKDYEWAKQINKKYGLSKKITVFFSPTFRKLNPKTLANWIIKDNLDVPLGLQLHKILKIH